MKQAEFSETQFMQIMQKSMIDLPFSDFEENLMQQLESESILNTEIQKKEKISFIFFLAGTCLGFVLNYLLQWFKSSIFGITPQTIILSFQTIFVLLFITQLDRFIKNFKRVRTI
jgi:drug/metabolite transporter (DMT)-like permease